MKKILALSILCLVLIFANFNRVFSQSQEPTEEPTEKVEIHFFYSETCPVCAKEKEFLKELQNKYPAIDIKKYEITRSSENRKVLQEFFEKYQVPKRERGWVPVTFTPDNYFIGFNQQIAKNIEGCVEKCLEGKEQEVLPIIKIPFIGKVDVSKLSLPVLTVVLGGLDAFNPCAMWVLLFLIVLLFNTRSRKRMFLVGGVFIAASGIVYYLLLSAWLNLFLAISYVNLTRIVIGIFALGVGIWQIRNFVRFKPGTCKISDGKNTLGDKIKNRLKTRLEKIVFSPLSFGMLVGVVILAFGVNLVEFFCSAGLPAIYTRILTLSQISILSYYLYLLLYTFVFVLDDLIIFSIAAIGLSKIGFTEKYNYWATLIGGVLIFILGILLIFKPEFLMFS